MNRRRLVFIGIAAVLVGSFSSSAVYRSLQKRMERPVTSTPVVVAARDLMPGEALEEHDLKVLAYPSAFLPDGVLHSTESALKRSVLLPVGKGQFVTSNNVGIDGEGHTLERLIPAGMRAAAVSVDEWTSVAGFARPGSLVDVLVTGNVGTGRLQSMTVLQRVRVLAVGSQTEASKQSAGPSARVVTLLVTPGDAEKLAFAAQEGRIQLSIRNPVDSSQENRTPVNSLGGPPAARKIRLKYVPAPVPPEHEIDIFHGDHVERIKVKD